MSDALSQAARLLAGHLQRTAARIVFAESCTAGLVSASLGGIAGISRYLCGSAVTYRERTKVDWLQVSESALRQHSAVSPIVTREMALGVLAKTAEADWSAAVTGHLGPDAPSELDGVIYVAVARRLAAEVQLEGEWQEKLLATERASRQREAAMQVLLKLQACLPP